jgi:DNA-damage-inducible protein D
VKLSKKVSKVKDACENSKELGSDHFVDINKMVELGSGAERNIEDIIDHFTDIEKMV